MIPFIDSHSHLADPAFDDDRDAVIARARAAGAEALVCIGESIDAAHRARAIAARHAGLVYWTAGVHPHDAAAFDEARDIPALDACLTEGAVAVGECGLDYHYDHSPRDAQRAAVRAQIALAARRKRPVVIHTREAEDDTRAVIDEAARAGVVGVLHCYTGSTALAEFAIAHAWSVSFSGIITFKKFASDALLALVPDDRVLVESDAPYLAPVPHRGRRNESSWVPLTLARLAYARGADLDELSTATIRNARRLFGLGEPPPPG
ncbi:MAG TPA: TatD family hydrolase [Gemmatimonadaceae bacterium]|nr:TatD family hydrolase [Gemmatimonadaceae bacterium]